MSKYKAKKTMVDGIVFDSKAEATRYNELKLLQQAGEISELKLQPSFKLVAAFNLRDRRHRAINYIADFMYIENGMSIVEDVKGIETEVFKIKRKLFLADYGDAHILRIYRKGQIIDY